MSELSIDSIVTNDVCTKAALSSEDALAHLNELIEAVPDPLVSVHRRDQEYPDAIHVSS